MDFLIREIDHNDVHFVSILTDNAIEINSYLFDVQFRAQFKQYKNVHILQLSLALRAIYRDKKKTLPSACCVLPLLQVESLT